jgi:hypothetical protein
MQQKSALWQGRTGNRPPYADFPLIGNSVNSGSFWRRRIEVDDLRMANYFCTGFGCGCCVAVRASGFFGDQSSGGNATRQN